MITLLVGLLEAFAGSDLVDTLVLHTSRDGVRTDRATIHTRLQAACDHGESAACAAVDVPPGDREGLAAALGPACDHDDGAACLGLAWTLLPPSGSALDPAAPSDPARYRTLVERACTLGVPRACTELGSVFRDGVATWAGRPRAIDVWRPLCADGEARACTELGVLAVAAGHPELAAPILENAVAFGDLSANLVLASLEAPAEAADRRASACRGGVTAACLDAAEGLRTTDPDRATAVVAEACALGDPPSCALAVHLDAVLGRMAADIAVSRLEALCPAVPSACEDAAFLSGGAEPVLTWTGSLPQGERDIDRGLSDAAPALFACLLGALSRDPAAAGEVRAVWRLEPDGSVGGAYVPEGLDPEHAICVADALRATRFRPPTGGRVRVERVLSTWHGATIELDSPGGPDRGDVLAGIRKDTPRWAGPLDTCALLHDAAESGISVTAAFTTGHDRKLHRVEVVKSNGTPELDACVVGWLGLHELGRSPGVPTNTLARITFLTPADTDPGAVRVPRVRTPLPGPSPTTTVRMLVLVVRRSDVGGKHARLTDPQLASIRKAHAEMAEWVALHTHGAVTLAWELREVEDRLGGGAFLDDPGGYERWNIDVGDVPPEIVQRVEPGRWDSVYLWAPIPRGFPQPALGLTWYAELMRGATFSTGVLQHRRVLHANPGIPAVELPLHEWWHQVEARANGLLGIDLPSNHQLLRIDGVALEPRTWLPNGPGNAMDWYDEVLGYEVHPELWQALWTAGRDQNVAREGNLAYDAIDIGTGAIGASVLNDGVVSFGGFHTAREVPAHGDGAWFALGWPAPVTVGRVVARLGTRDGPSVQRVTIEGLRGGVWSALDERDVSEPVLEVSFPPIPVEGLRVRVVTPVEGVKPRCSELEVYGGQAP